MQQLIFSDDEDAQIQGLDLLEAIAETPSDIYEVFNMPVPKGINNLSLEDFLVEIQVLFDYLQNHPSIRSKFDNFVPFLKKLFPLDTTQLPDFKLVYLLPQIDDLSIDIRYYSSTSLPKSIEYLTNLTSLDLMNNDLGQLSTEQLKILFKAISKFPNLTRLDLGSNKFTTLPDSIDLLTNLKTLDLSSNRLTTLPNTIGNLKKLELIDLTYNMKKGSSTKTSLKTLPLSIKNIPNLTFHVNYEFTIAPVRDFLEDELDFHRDLSSLYHPEVFRNKGAWIKKYGGLPSGWKNNPKKKVTRGRIKKNTGKKDFLENLKNEAKIILSPDFYYGSAADLVLQKGHFPKISKALSEEQIEYVNSVIEDSMIANEGARIGNCYHNVFALILADRQERMEFVEGFASTSNGEIFHHAWVELDDGYIVDLTWSNDEDKNQKRIRSETTQCSLDISDRVLGEIPHGYNYLGVIIPKKDVIDFFYKNRVTKLLLQIHTNNWKYLREEWI